VPGGECRRGVGWWDKVLRAVAAAENGILLYGLSLFIGQPGGRGGGLAAWPQNGERLRIVRFSYFCVKMQAD